MANMAEIAPLAITMGEPAGIGPELIARAWRGKEKHSLPSFVYVGSHSALQAADNSIPTKLVTELSDAAGVFTSALPVYDIPTVNPVIPGTIDANNGAAVIEAIQFASKKALSSEVSAIVTAPINKAALYNVGFDAPGHTEFLSRLCDLPDNHSIMMLTAQDLKVVPVTIHIPLKDVASQLTADKIIHAGMVTAFDLKKRFGIKKPRLAIAGLNPHAGESGAIGMEESTHIMPAVWTLRDNGVDVTDPLPADTLFHAEARQQYDAVLCMYHDQALIPVKTLDFWGGVNATLGLPIIRTSPDHGTALELAGSGKARIDSMIAAIHLAYEMATRQAK